MYKLIPFKKDHVIPLSTESINAYLPNWYTSGQAEEMEQTHAFTAMKGEDVMMCGGITELWPGRGHLWCILSEKTKTDFVSAFRTINKFLKDQPYTRVEMSVPYSFSQGHRRAILLGFDVECERAKKYLPNGDDCTLYVKIKEVPLGE
jgi:hypothetical protein